MFWQDCMCGEIDGDAENMLEAVYGPYQGGGGSGCSECNVLCPPGSSCFPLQGYLSKAWNLSQGMTGLPNPVSMLTPPGCSTTSGYIVWAECVTNYYVSRT
jgi:hypothetical protein